MITGIAGNMESMLVEQWAYRETDEHRENLFHQQSICLAVNVLQVWSCQKMTNWEEGFEDFSLLNLPFVTKSWVIGRSGLTTNEVEVVTTF